MTENFTRDELATLQRALGREAAPRCPRCGGVVELTAIPPKPSVAYVRDRVLFQCRSCRLKGVTDRK